MVSKVVSLFVFALLVNNFNFIKKNKLNKWKIKIDTIPFIFSSNPKNYSFFLYIGRRFGIGKRAGPF
jgi:hypothetical protein